MSLIRKIKIFLKKNKRNKFYFYIVAAEMKKTFKEGILVFSIFLLLGLIIQKSYFEKFPRHIHAWAQCDRYALSKGFMDNDFNPFLAQTYVQNLQFPGNYKEPSESSVTSVDLPLADFIAAVFMETFSVERPVIFRSVIFIFGLIATLYFFKLCRLLGARFELSLFMSALFFMSPLFLYYQISLMPSVPSLCFLIIGLYHFFKFQKEQKRKILIFSVLFLTLASLNRLTFVVPFFALFCWEIYSIILQKKKQRNNVFAIIVGLLIVLLYWLYNKKIATEYGSLFLNELLYPKSFTQALSIVSKSLQNWFSHYYSYLHYFVFTIAIILNIIYFKRSDQKKEEGKNSISMYLIIWFLGLIIFSLLMLKQFEHHDYYFIDTFFLPVLISITLLLIPFQNQMTKSAWWFGLLVFSAGMIFIGVKNLEKRYSESPLQINTIVYENFKNANTLLKKLNIEKDKKMLILDAYIPNMGLLLMDRKGFVIMTTSKENIQKALKWNYDYIVFQNNLFFDDVYKNYPEIIQEIEVIGKNEGISIAQLKSQKSQTELNEFLGLEKIRFVYFDNFEDAQVSDLDSVVGVEGFFSSQSYQLSSTENFALTQMIDKDMELNGGILNVNFQLKKEKMGECFLVVSSNEGNGYYKTYSLEEVQANGHWHEVNRFFKIPKLSKESKGLKVYLWNKGKGQYRVDDFRINYY